MSGYVAAALVGIEAETHEEAWNRATHEADLPWEIAACVPQVTAHKAVEAIVEATSHGQPLVDTMVERMRRPMFGKFSLIAIPMMMYGYFADTSSLSAIVGALGALASIGS